MELTGRIIKVLPTRSGVSQSTGNEWKALPFVFGYFESPESRYEDRMILETLDTSVMAQIAKFVATGEDGKAIIENGEVKMTGMVKCKVNIGHRTNEWNGKTYNEIKLFRMEVLTAVGVTDALLAGNPQGANEQGTTQGGGGKAEPVNWDGMATQDGNEDDLPF